MAKPTTPKKSPKPAKKSTPDKSTVPAVGDILLEYQTWKERYKNFEDAWAEVVIIAQNRVSLFYVLASPKNQGTGTSLKFAKSVLKSCFFDGRTPSNFSRNQEEVRRRGWVNINSNRIGEQVQRLTDYDLLQAIAKLINYEERK